MAVREKRSSDDTEPVIKAMAHPLRLQLLTMLNQRVASPNELAKDVDASLGTVSYHVRQLLEFGCIELVSTAQRRGATEHYYRAVVRPYFTDGQWARLPRSARTSLSATALEFILGELVEAARSGELDARTDRHLSRSPLELDEEGWAELVERLNELLERSIELEGESLDRHTRAGTPLFRSSLVLALYGAEANDAAADAKPTKRRAVKPRRRSTR